MTQWRDFVKKHYREMKKKDSNAKFGDALKHAAKEWKKSKKGRNDTEISAGKRKTKRRNRKSRKTRRH